MAKTTKINQKTEVKGNINSLPAELTIVGGNVSIDLSRSNVFYLTVSQNVTFLAPTNKTKGVIYTFVLNNTSTYTASWHSDFKFPSTPTLPTNKSSSYSFICSPINETLILIGNW